MRKCRIACTLNNSFGKKKMKKKPLAKRLYQIKAIRVYSLSRSDILPIHVSVCGRNAVDVRLKRISMTKYADSLKLIKVLKVS